MSRQAPTPVPSKNRRLFQPIGILENAAEIDRLYALQGRAEQQQMEAVKRKQDAEADAERYEGQQSEASERIEVLFDGMACTIPTTSDECLALAILLRGMTADSVWYQDDTQPRIRADRILDNLVVGLSRLSHVGQLPDWLTEHIRGAETGTTHGLSDDASARGANENRKPVQQH